MTWTLTQKMFAPLAFACAIALSGCDDGNANSDKAEAEAEGHEEGEAGAEGRDTAHDELPKGWGTRPKHTSQVAGWRTCGKLAGGPRAPTAL